MKTNTANEFLNNFIKTNCFKIGSRYHRELMNKTRKYSKLTSLLINKCDIEIFNKKIVILKFPFKSIYSEQALEDKIKIQQIFSKILNKEIEIIVCIGKLKKRRK